MKRYTRGAETVTAVDHFDLAVMHGETVALVGASGSGKSTILNLIAGFDRADEGCVRIEDFDVTAATPATLDAMRTRLLGFVFQQFHLVSGLTAVENVELALSTHKTTPAERRQRSLEALRRVGLEGLEARRPVQLSGGQQQRVAIARAIVGGPNVILADEPTAALDAETAKGILDEFARLSSAGCAVLFSTHDSRCIARADRTIAIENGRLSA
ncbi:MAG: ABC transporter ATP-binding protein [Alphaproteobacteria bacterium]